MTLAKAGGTSGPLVEGLRRWRPVSASLLSRRSGSSAMASLMAYLVAYGL
jgi:hypothetical protein